MFGERAFRGVLVCRASAACIYAGWPGEGLSIPWTPISLADLRCACGDPELFAVAPGDAGERVDLLSIAIKAPVPLKCWCESCWRKEQTT